MENRIAAPQSRTDESLKKTDDYGHRPIADNLKALGVDPATGLGEAARL